jgi:hypothetical protein
LRRLFRLLFFPALSGEVRDHSNGQGIFAIARAATD